MRVVQASEEVFFARDRTVNIGREDIGPLKDIAKSSRRKTTRLCAHTSIDDELHEMFIVHARDTYIRPHNHLNKSVSFHVIEGVADLVLFDESGDIADVIPLGSYGSGRSFYSRISEPRYYTQVIQSEYLVFHEINKGPFIRSETLWAPWAPDQSDEDDAREYMKRLGIMVENWGA